MKAIGLYKYLPVDHEESLLDLEVPQPDEGGGPKGHDLLVRVKAISVNPVDTKIRAPKAPVETIPRVLGWDVAGVVEAAGPDCTMFHPGEEVFYAGSIVRPGCNSELHLVDERIVGRKPVTLTFAEAAALPLTSITAWEALFDRMHVARNGSDRGKVLLIVGGAGGVGSIAIQIAKKVAQLTVIATASRPESREWCLARGADVVIDHRQPIPAQLRAAGFLSIPYILCLNDLDAHYAEMAEVVAPFGFICSIVGASKPIALDALWDKSAGFVWELMFTRPKYGGPDMSAQHDLLNEVSRLVDSGELVTTAKQTLSPINAANLRKAHHMIEQGHTIGKVVLEGF